MSTSKGSKIRISQLAKELGVTSKDIVLKCQREQIPGVSSAASTVSVGLSLTIREWFSGAAGGTAVETAEKVDVVEAKKRATTAKSTKKKKGDEASGDAPAPTSAEPVEPKPAVVKAKAGARATRTTEPASATTPAASSAPAVAPNSTSATKAAAAAPAAGGAADAPAGGVTPPNTAAAGRRSSLTSGVIRTGASGITPRTPPAGPGTPPPASPGLSGPSSGQTGTTPVPARPTRRTSDTGPRATPNVPRRPEVVKPAGQMLSQPTKTALSGPKVVRVEEPDRVATPRPRTGPGTTGPGSPGRISTRAGSGFGGAGVRTGGPTGPSGPVGRGRDDRRTGSGDKRAGGRAEGGGRSAKAGGDAPFEPWRAQDLIDREGRLTRAGGFFKSHKATPGRGGAGGRTGPGGRVQAQKSSGPVKIAEPIVIKELSAATGVKATDILKKLLLSGTMATINSVIETARAEEIMLEFDIVLEVASEQTAEDAIASQFAQRERKDPRARSPVITILGHVDHGKTSLLDRIRKANVAAGEAGGITQATSAFMVPVKAGDTDRTLTFIDTPGHEAFTAMRSRGARITDIVVLVVDAVDGVMPQTVESINHSKAAGVPIVVALNKIDKPEAGDKTFNRIYGQLAEHGLNTVPWGGDVEVVKTSALKDLGIQELLDMLALVADMKGIVADWAGNAQGAVLEAQMEEGRGPVARVLVQEGVLKKGDSIVIGRASGRIRDIVDDRGQRVMEAIPGTPCAVSGLDELPDAGDKFFVVDSLKEAEQAANERRQAERLRELAAPKVTLDNILEHIGKDKAKELSLVVKADVQGSVETLKVMLPKISVGELKVTVKHCAVGGINESDMLLAETTGAIVVGFNVTTNAKARALAESKKVDVRLYDVIYHISEDIEKALKGMLEPTVRIDVLGHAEVRQVFRISKVGAVAGCYVTDGTVERNAQIRVTRGGIVIEKDRRLEQLKRFKDDAKEVRSGNECGMKIVGYDDIQVGDVLECYKSVVVREGSDG
ncbi:MAG: translation initiation factor IF-2 [Planctomycetes bacterium]|nr:translation initiation factor IF-2 [Planctomycetota bacterium]